MQRLGVGQVGEPAWREPVALRGDQLWAADRDGLGAREGPALESRQQQPERSEALPPDWPSGWREHRHSGTGIWWTEDNKGVGFAGESQVGGVAKLSGEGGQCAWPRWDRRGGGPTELGVDREADVDEE